MQVENSKRALEISRILHAGYVMRFDRTRIAFDPIFENPFSRNCHAYPNVRFDLNAISNLKLDAVFISHHHDDHCSLESLNLLRKDTPIWLYCERVEMFSWIERLGFEQVNALRVDETVRVGEIEVTPRLALDADVDCLFQVRAAGLNVLNVVDSWIDPTTLDLLKRDAPWDMVLWPFQTMLEIPVIAPTLAPPASREIPHEWIAQLRDLDPKYVVPSACQFVHEDWSWYNEAMFPISYAGFRSQLREALPSATVVRMNPSRSFVLDRSGLIEGSPLEWVVPIGDQEVDYEFDPHANPTPTAEIAKILGPITSEQMERVRKFCVEELSAKYAIVGEPGDPYFEKPRTWRLTLFDHEGDPETYLYQIKGESLEQLSTGERRASWSTEVPASKLYAALENGESLTSMYLRINSLEFSPEIEREISEVDVMDDPLVRCLFFDSFGSYQLAQLARIES